MSQEHMTDGAIVAFDSTVATTRGYTGHEMLDPVGLIHMNGRVGACPGERVSA